MSNLYTLMDYKEMWKASSTADMKSIAKTKQFEWAKQIIEAAGGRVIAKESGTTAPTKATAEPDSIINHFSGINNNVKKNESQDLERYTLEDIKELFDYSVIVNDFPQLKDDVENVITILHDIVNTTKKTIRVAGEDLPAMPVIGKLMKLTSDEILYSIRKYAENLSPVKNPRAYMLTILYRAKEQYALDIQNQVNRNLG